MTKKSVEKHRNFEKKLSLKPAILFNTVELSTFRVPSLCGVSIARATLIGN